MGQPGADQGANEEICEQLVELFSWIAFPSVDPLHDVIAKQETTGE